MPQRRIGILSQLVPPKATWTEEKVPDQKGKTVIITGGNIGIGRETARVLLSKGAKVYIATRPADKAQAVIDELKGITENESIFFLELNLADLDSVKAAAEEFIRKEPELHTLYNNRYERADQTTSQGFDTIFGTNVLGHFYFTKLLLPVLIATAKNSPAGTVRVINMSSIAHYMPASDGIRYSTIGPGTDAVAARKKLGAVRLFGQSQLGNILFSNELAKRYGGDGIVSISLFPGVINADLTGYAGSFWQGLKRLLAACVLLGTCILAGGDLEALAEDSGLEELPHTVEGLPHTIENRLVTEFSRQPRVRQNSGVPKYHDSGEPPEPSKVYPHTIEELPHTIEELPHTIEELPHTTEELPHTIENRLVAESSRVRQNSGVAKYPDSGEPPEPSKVYHRAITSLYAGTDPEASRLNGKYLTAWARVTLPSKKALSSQLGATLWNWCEEQVKKDTKVNEDVKAEEGTKVGEDIKPKVEEDVKADEVTKVVEVTKAEEDTKAKEDIKVEEGTKVEEVTKADEATEAKEDTKSKE